jgi:WD40 repeat protein
MNSQWPVDPTAARIEREWKHSSPLIGCRFDPSGRYLFASAQDYTVRRFDLLTGAATALAGHASWVRGLDFAAAPAWASAEVAYWERTRDAKIAAAGAAGAALPPPRPHPFTLLTGDYHGRLLWWRGDADVPKPVRSVAAHDGWLRAVAVSPDGRTAATCGNDHLVKLWSVADGTLLRTLTGHDCHVYNVAFHPGGGRLASADLKGVVKDWDLKTAECVRDLDAKVLYKYDMGFRADIGGARSMTFDPAGSRLACAGITNVSNAFAGVGNPLVVVIDWADGKAKQLKPKDAYQGTCWGVAFHPAGFVAAAGGGSGGRVWFWAGDDAASSHTVALPYNARDLALSPAGDRLAVAGGNGTAAVLTLRSGPPAKK